MLTINIIIVYIWEIASCRDVSLNQIMHMTSIFISPYLHRIKMSLVLVITKLCNSYKSQFTSKSVLVWKETNSHTKTLIPHLLEVLKCPIYSFPRIYSYKIFHHYWMGGMNQKNSERMSLIDARNLYYISCRVEILRAILLKKMIYNPNEIIADVW